MSSPHYASVIIAHDIVRESGNGAVTKSYLPVATRL